MRSGPRTAVFFALLLIGGCHAGVGDYGECGGDCTRIDSLGDGAADGGGWADEFVATVDTEVQRHSTYASTEGGIGGCVATWTVGGAALGEVASKTCVVVGVAASETGVGAIAAAVCAGADWIQADAVLGAAAGYLSGYAACSAAATFDRYAGSFRLFNVGPDDAEDDDEGVGSDDGVEAWNTPECRAKYDDYKAACGLESRCSPQQLSCEDLMIRWARNTECAELRSDHLYSCPHPDDFDWQGHETAIGEAYVSAQSCRSRLCQSTCIDQISADLLPVYDNICN